MADSPRIIFLEHKKDGELADAISVTLQDPNGQFGIREIESGVVVVPPGTPVQHVGTGKYEYNVDSLNRQIEYEYFFKVIDEDNQVQFIYGDIPKVSSTTTGSNVGPTIPADKLDDGVQVDIDGDGIFDGYAYDLDADGYNESFDLNDDTIVDQIDVGKEVPPGDPDQFDPRGVRIGIGGSRGGTTNFVEGELDGKPDVPSAKGTAADDGTWGGTFGYDGLSGNTPATGGHRTNRDTHGTGYWDGISFKNLCAIPIGPRGQCFKDKAHAATRAFLKDTDPGCLAFSDDEIDMFLESSLWAFNAKPTFTAFIWDHMQDRWLDIITKGAVIWALYAQSLIEAGREFTITDNGISYTPPPVSDKMQSYASTLLQHYDTTLTEIKSNFKPLPAAVGIFSVLDISPSLRRLRHLREKRIF